MSLRFAPGQTTILSGVYRAIHADNHIPRHFLIALHGETFPNSINCGNQVRLELALSAARLHDHTHFKRSGDTS